MSAVMDRGETALNIWKRGPDGPALVALLGQCSLRLRLERVHFPGKRPIQLVYSARMPARKDAAFLAEYCPDGAEDVANRATASLGKTRNGQRSALSTFPIVADPATGLVLRRPGLDERLPGLRVLHDPAFARETIAGITGRDPGKVTTQLMAHRLGKRAVIRITGANGSVFARVRAIKSDEGESRFARHRMIWEALDPGAPLAIPEPLGRLPQLGLSLFGELPGRAPGFSTDHIAVARALAALRALHLDGMPHHSGTDEARILQDWHDRCRAYRPDIASRVEPILARTCADLAETEAEVAPCHRDLHEKQILVRGNRAGFLDFDTLSLADPGLDPGNLLAHLFFAGLDEGPLRQALVGLDCGFWRRTALLRLAMIYAFTATPDAAIRRLIEEAER